MLDTNQKLDKDVSEWLPDLNRCWYVARTILVRREYGLTIDRAEADAIDRVLAGCASSDSDRAGARNLPIRSGDSHSSL